MQNRECKIAVKIAESIKRNVSSVRIPPVSENTKNVLENTKENTNNDLENCIILVNTDFMENWAQTNCLDQHYFLVIRL